MKIKHSIPVSIFLLVYADVDGQEDQCGEQQISGPLNKMIQWKF